jgi:hypothetical protein
MQMMWSCCLNHKQVFNKKLLVLEEFCNEWCLDVNISKTKILIFNKAGRHLKENFKFNTAPLEYVASYKYLGIYFTASGSFSHAQEELYNKRPMGHIAHLSSLGQYRNIFFQYSICISFPFAPSDPKGQLF